MSAQGETLSYALELAKLGYKVFPCKADKKPNSTHGFKDATNSAELIRSWAGKWQLIGIAAQPSGVFVIDLDNKNGVSGSGAWNELVKNQGNNQPVMVGPVQTTPSGGYHLIFKYPQGFDIPNNAGQLAPGIDIRSTGYICSGVGYSWLPEHSAEVQLTAAPAWLLELIKNLKPPKSENTTTTKPLDKKYNQNPQESGEFWLQQAVARATIGRRNDSCFWMGLQLRDSGIALGDAEQLARTYAASVPGEDFTEGEAVSAVRSAYTQPARQPAKKLGGNGGGAPKYGVEMTGMVSDNRPNQQESTAPAPAPILENIALTDSGNAEYLAALYGDKLRYDHRRRRWLIWNEHRWERDENELITRCSLDAARARLKMAVDLKDDDRRSRMVKWALASENHSRLNAAIDIAKALHPITTSGATYDADPWVVGCNNGVIDLRTGELRPGRPTDDITMNTGVDFYPGAQAPRFNQFMQEVFNGDEDLIDFVQMAVGYSLSGITREHAIFLCYGSGANGKSTLFNAIRAAFGEYSTNTPFSTFELNQQSVNNDVAALAGTRFVTAAETSEARKLNEARIKAITGGDPVTARFLFGEWFTYTPTYKVWLAMNHKPVITANDDGIWRRVRLLPFVVNFRGKEDKLLGDTLKAEAPGILAWAVRGCQAWLNHGDLITPAAVQKATDDYRLESDVIGQFLEECTIEKPDGRISGSSLYAAYKKWCVQAGEREITGTAFGRRIKERDGIDYVKTGHKVWYLGRELCSENEEIP